MIYAEYWSQSCTIFVSSVRSSSVYQGLIEIRRAAEPTFSSFSNSSDSKVKVKSSNMCYIFEKHGIQGRVVRYNTKVKNDNFNY